MFLKEFFCLFLVVFVANLVAAANEPAIFSDNLGYRPGWKTAAWSVKASEVKSSGKKLIKLKYLGNRPWGGVRFFAENKSSEIKTDKKFPKGKSLVLHVNGGTDSMGRHLGGQIIQIQLKFRLADNSLYNKKYVLCAPFTEGEAIDNDPDTWQQIAVPLSLFIKKNDLKAAVRSIINCSIQFYGKDIPKSPIYIRNFKIADTAAKKKKIPLAPPRTDIVFKEYDQIPEYLKVKPNYKVTRKGPNYIVDGKARFLAGTQVSRQIAVGIEYKTTPGYDRKYNWIYEKLPNFKSAQRIGFDTMGCFVPGNWMKKYDSTIRFGENSKALARFGRFIREMKMPMYIDFTLFPWGSGKLVDSNKIPQRAKSNPKLKQHWLGYDLDNEDGMRLMKDYWKFGTGLVVKNKVNPLFYELFNEPTYFCDCKENRKSFVKWLKEKHGSVSNMNKKWRTQYKTFEDVARFRKSVDKQGLYVDYSQFLEDRWIDILKTGIATIKSVDKRKNIQITCQSSGPYVIDPHLASLNCYKMSSLFSTIQAPTGCGALSHVKNIGARKAPTKAINAPMQNRAAIQSSMTMKILRSVSPDKPIVNGESGFPPANRQGLCDRYWLEMMWGVNASYLFVWTRRAWDIRPNTSVEAAMIKAKQFPYILLNPYAIPTSALPGIMDFKKEMLTLQDIVVEQPRGVKSEIALLHSFSSKRYSFVSKTTTAADEIINYYGALVYSYYPFDVLLEEQIRDSKKYQQYKVIVAGGIQNTLPSVRKKLKDYVKSGGTLILGLSTLANDEYNNKVDGSKWAGVKLAKTENKVINLKFSIAQTAVLSDTIRGLSYAKVTPRNSSVIARAGNAPVITVKKLGKGKIYYIGGIFREGNLIAVLSTLLEKEKVKKPVELVRLDKSLLSNTESILVDRGDTKLVFLWNWDLYTKVAKLKLKDYFLMDSAYICDPLKKISWLTKEGKSKWTAESFKSSDIYLKIPPHGKAVLLISKKPWTKSSLTKYKPQELLKHFSKAAKENLRKNASLNKAALEKEKNRVFKVKTENCFTVDIRKYCNRSFLDRVAEDGLGGWTDQGKSHSLRELNAGRNIFLNIPFDIIRYDQNNDTSCIFFKTKSRSFGVEKVNIPLMKKAKSLFFLHAAAWSKAGKPTNVLKYTIYYTDGSRNVAVAKCQKDLRKSHIGDWWKPTLDFNKDVKVGWTNSEGHGLYIWRWHNPEPEKVIKSIKISSFNNTAVPIVVGISAEKVN